MNHEGKKWNCGDRNCWSVYNICLSLRVISIISTLVVLFSFACFASGRSIWFGPSLELKKKRISLHTFTLKLNKNEYFAFPPFQNVFTRHN